MSELCNTISIQTALIAEEIERTRQLCDRSCELLRLPVPDTFLGRKLDRAREKEKRKAA